MEKLESVLEKFIKINTKKLTERLGVPLIKIKVVKEFDNCSYLSDEHTLIFGLSWLLQLKSNKDERINKLVPQDKFFSRVYFVVAHEIAHYLQHYKFPEWFRKGCYEYSLSGIDNYIKRKIERNAQKIAHILFREYKANKKS